MARLFLSKWETVSKAWISPTILYFILGILKIRLFTVSIVTTLVTIQHSAQNMCEHTNKLYDETAQTSRYLEALFLSAIEVFMNYVFALVKMLISLLISISIALITFAIEIYLGTITCLSTAFIHGTLECLTNVLHILADTIQKAVNGVLKEFNLAMSGLSKVINLILLGFGAVESLFGSPNSSNGGAYQATVLKVNLTVSSLKNITLPTTYIDDIKSFADKIPNFEDVLSNVTSLVTLPLHRLAHDLEQKQLMFEPLLNNFRNSTVSSQRNFQLVSCEDIDRSFTTAVKNTKYALTTTIIVVSIATAAFAIFLSALAFYRSQKKMTLFEILSSESVPENVGNQIQLFNLGIWSKFINHLSPHTKWFLSYSFFQSQCLVIGFLGFFTVWVQCLFLQIVKKELQIVGENTSNFGNVLQIQATQLVEKVQSSVNGLIEALNNILFSSIKDTSTSILSKISGFQSEINDTISLIFNGTPFAYTVRSVVYCTIGRKVDGVESGLSWIVKQLNIPVPQVLKVLQIANNLLNNTGNPRNESILHTSLSQSITEYYETTERAYYKSLKDELIISSVLVGIWLIYSLIGGMIAWRRKRAHAELEFGHEISWPKRLVGSNKTQYPCIDPLPHSS